MSDLRLSLDGKALSPAQGPEQRCGGPPDRRDADKSAVDRPALPELPCFPRGELWQNCLQVKQEAKLMVGRRSGNNLMKGLVEKIPRSSLNIQSEKKSAFRQEGPRPW